MFYFLHDDDLSRLYVFLERLHLLALLHLDVPGGVLAHVLFGVIESTGLSGIAVAVVDFTGCVSSSSSSSRISACPGVSPAARCPCER